MQRINTPNKYTDLFGAGKHGYRDGNKAQGIPATELSAASCNAIQEELSAIPEAAGLTLDPNDNAQVLAAIRLLIEARVGDYSIDTGAANAYVVALNPAITAYTGNFSGSFKVAHANTGASTLNAGGGAITLRNDAGGVLVSGDLPLGAIVTYQYVHADSKFYITSMVTSQALTKAAADALYAPLGTYGVPAGTIIDFAGAAAPAGYLECPLVATNISRTTYAALFAAIGTTWGAGNGTTTFGMPFFPADYASVQANANVGTETVGEVIAHTHGFASNVVSNTSTGTILTGPGSTVQSGSTGGAANLAAGVRVLKCVKI